MQWTKELRRVLALPRRGPTVDPLEVSALFLRPGATGTLRPLQAQALADAFERRGGLFLLGVGEGKTLLSLLLPTLLQAQRPLLLVPGALLEKTSRDRAELDATWRVAPHVRIESYELVARADHAYLLDHYRPDLIVADECHMLASAGAGCTRRVGRYLAEDAPGTMFCGMTGSIMKHDLQEWAHLARWALGASHAPLPAGWPELAAWNAVLGAKADPTTDPGALASAFGTDYRGGFREHFRATPGIIAGPATEVDAGLEISRLPIARSGAVDAALRDLDKRMVRPDGWELMDKVEAWPVRRELVLGFFYRWDPPPPREWLVARRLWTRVVRRVLGTNRSRIDTAEQVSRDVDAGGHPFVTLDPDGRVSTVDALAAWRAIAPTFEPNTVPVWLDDVLEHGPAPVTVAARRWTEQGPGIIFCEHAAVAHRIAGSLGLILYGEGGFSADGRYIDDAPADGPCIVATTRANSKGRNLQHWSRALVVSPPPNSKEWEQLLGRLHRLGQDADVVRYDVIDGGLSSWVDDVRQQAANIGGLFGQRQRLELATWV